jgi:hypothetical protein
VLAFGLAIALAAASQSIDHTRSAAECLVRAEYELILCADSPSPWIPPALGLAIVVLAVAIGMEISRRAIANSV